MGKATNMRSWETHASKTNPDRNYGGFRSMNIVTDLGGEVGMDSFGYISFARPFPLGAKILSATLTFHTWAIDDAGSHSIELRRVADRFAHHLVTWENRPGVVPTGGITVTKTGPQPTHEEWVYDVTEHLQKVSDGEPWYGWRITTSDSDWVRIVAQEAAGASRGFEPSLTIVWSDQPDEPASLHPDEGVVGTPVPALSFEYLPIDEDAILQKVHVQTSTSESFAVPAWDSGERDWTDPTVYIGDLGYPGATQGDVVYWRIRVMDQGGWSGWSPVAEFTYIPEPALTMLSPPGPGTPIDGGDSLLVEGFITDMTPTFTWSCPEQVAYHITVALNSDTFSGKGWIWDSGRVEATTQSIELPKGVITRDDVKYRIILRAFDKHDRQSVANDPYTYAGARIIVEMTDDPAITKVTDVVGTQVPGTPEVEVTWKRGAAADEWIIIRDGLNDVGSSRRVFVEEVDNIDVVQPDGTYKYIDKGAPPRTPYRYSIYPVINGKRGTGTLGNVVETRLDGIWLVMPDFSLVISGSDEGSWLLPEKATVHQVIGATSSTTVREVHQGYEGSLSGMLVEEHMYQPELSAQVKRDRFLEIKEDPRGARLVIADMNIPVDLANLNVHPTPHHDLRFACSFDFWQNDEVWWERL